MRTSRVLGFLFAFILGLNGVLAAQLITGGVGIPSGGAIGGSGTIGTLAKFTAAQTIGNSILTESGTTVTVTGTLNATNFNGIIGATTPAAGTFTTVTANTSVATPIFTTNAANPAASGLVRSANNVGFNWRNSTNAGDIGIKVNSGNMFDFTAGGTYPSGYALETSGTTRLTVNAGGNLTHAIGANLTAYDSTGYSVTGSGTVAHTSVVGTLNTSGVTHVNDWSITNTASGAGSTLFRIRAGAAGATDIFAINADGTTTTGGTATVAAATCTVAVTSITIKNGLVTAVAGTGC